MPADLGLHILQKKHVFTDFHFLARPMKTAETRSEPGPAFLAYRVENFNIGHLIQF